MQSKSVVGEARLLLALVGWAALLGQACGGKSEKGSGMNAGDSPPTEEGSGVGGRDSAPISDTPNPDATAGAGGTADDPAIVSTSPYTSSRCATSEWESCRSFGGKIQGYFVAVDADDHLFIAGSALLNPSDQARTPFVAKYSAKLELIWLQQLDSSLSLMQGLAVDARGNSFVAGKPAYDKGSTIVKVSPDGASLWTRPCPGEALAGIGLAVDGDGDVVIGDSDKSTVRLAKYSPDGDQLWEDDRPAEDTEIVNYVAADAGGNIWLAADRKQPSGGRWHSGNLEKRGPTGKLEWTTSLDGSPVKALLSANGEALVLVDIPIPVTLIRVSAAGDALWRKELPHFFMGYGLASDLDGNTWVTGYTAENPTMGSVTKLSPEGDSVFSKDFDVPSFVGTAYVAQMSRGEAFIVGVEDYEAETLAIARLPP